VGEVGAVFFGDVGLLKDVETHGVIITMIGDLQLLHISSAFPPPNRISLVIE
jgi:hypothetical protein